MIDILKNSTVKMEWTCKIITGIRRCGKPVIYNEMILREFNVDVGILEHYYQDSAGKVQRSLEVDFVCNKGTQGIIYSRRMRYRTRLSKNRKSEAF